MQEVTGLAGQVIAGRYRLVELIGQGGMGCVWRADHLKLGSPIAIKLIRPEVSSHPGTRERFLREAKAAAMIRGAHVVQILDHGIDNDAPFIAMEYLEGESLAARLRREGKLGPAKTSVVMRGVARALRRAHKLGIVHRDLKPDNIFLAKDYGEEIAKVLDFGIAKVVGPVALDSRERKTETGTMLGTPCYMSPEQARGRKEMDTRSDLWSFGVITCECLTGKRPFDADALGELMMLICSEPIVDPSSLGPVPPGFDAWFHRAVERDPAARFQTIDELSDALSAILTPGEHWLEISLDGEPKGSDKAPITPFESSPTERQETPPEPAAAVPQESAPQAKTPAANEAAKEDGPVAPATALTRDTERPAHSSKRILYVGAAVIVMAAVLGLVLPRLSPSESALAPGEAAPSKPAAEVHTQPASDKERPDVPSPAESPADKPTGPQPATSPAVQAESTDAQPKSPAVQAESTAAQTKSPAVQAESTAAQAEGTTTVPAPPSAGAMVRSQLSVTRPKAPATAPSVKNTASATPPATASGKPVEAGPAASSDKPVPREEFE